MANTVLDAVDLLHTGGIDNPGGVATMHGYAMLGDITTLQAPDKLNAAAATLESVGSIATPHVFGTGKSMKKVYGTENKGSVDVKQTGELDGGGARSEFKFWHPGSKAKVDGWARMMRNNICIFFAQEADGTVRQIGNAQFPAHVSVNYGTGANNDGYRGYEVTVKAYGEAPIYTPGLNFTPAV
jgi:hypothetical protein